MAADYKTKKSSLESSFYSIDLATLQQMTQRIGMMKPHYSDVKHFADAITQFVETECFCLEIDEL